MSVPVYLNHLETANPPHDVHRFFVQYVSGNLDRKQRVLFEKLARKSGIERRYSFFEPRDDFSQGSLDVRDFYKQGSFPTTAQRMRFFEDHSMILARSALLPFFRRVDAKRITHLIVTNCTGMTAPGLDLLIQKEFGLASNVERTNIFFMGCFAAINALKSARHIVRSDPKAQVLVVSLELCTLHLKESNDVESLLGFLQFADGCAVGLVSADPHGLDLKSFRSEVFADAQDLITWKIGDQGFDMRLALDVPKVLGQSLPKVFKRLWQHSELPDLVAVHPGGRAILDEVESHLKFGAARMESSRKILREYGNMSSPTVLFVLNEIMRRNDLNGSGLALSFGPGLSVESLQFSKIPR